MLVLTRKYQEKIRIGDNITITVLRTKGKAVRLGIEAPAEVPVVRGELSFETADEADESYEASEVQPSAPAKRVKREPVTTSSWAAESPRTQVQMSRVPRKEVANFLPKLVAGSAPLRAMMEQR